MSAPRMPIESGVPEPFEYMHPGDAKEFWSMEIS